MGQSEDEDERLQGKDQDGSRLLKQCQLLRSDPGIHYDIVYILSV